MYVNYIFYIKNKIQKVMVLHSRFGLTRWAKSPKKRSVEVYFRQYGTVF